MSARQSDLRADLARAQRLLDAQEPGTVVVDKYGDAWQSDRVYWYRALGAFNGEPWSSWDLCQRAPITVVHTPTPAEARERVRLLVGEWEPCGRGVCAYGADHDGECGA